MNGGERTMAEMDEAAASKRLRVAIEARPEHLALFEPPATDAAIETLRAGTAGELPSVLEELLRWHDGTRRNYASYAGWQLLGADRILYEKETWDALAAPYDGASDAPRLPQGALWHPRWIPLGVTDEHVLALAPNACFGGPSGQIVELGFKPATGWTIAHASIAEWLVFLARVAEEDLVGADRSDARIVRIAKEMSPTARSFDCLALEGRFERDDRASEPTVQRSLEPGAIIEIARGRGAGLEARVLERIASDRLRVEVEIYGRRAVLEIDRSDVS